MVKFHTGLLFILPIHYIQAFLLHFLDSVNILQWVALYIEFIIYEIYTHTYQYMCIYWCIHCFIHSKYYDLIVKYLFIHLNEGFNKRNNIFFPSEHEID